jgi:hypothetical protein
VPPGIGNAAPQVSTGTAVSLSFVRNARGAEGRMRGTAEIGRDRLALRTRGVARALVVHVGRHEDDALAGTARGRHSSRAIAPPPMPTIVRLAWTIAVDVGESADEPGRRPPHVVSRTKNTSSTQRDSATTLLARQRRDDADRREAPVFGEVIDRADAVFRGADVDDRAARLELGRAPPSPARASRRGS